MRYGVSLGIAGADEIEKDVWLRGGKPDAHMGEGVQKSGQDTSDNGLGLGFDMELCNKQTVWVEMVTGIGKMLKGVERSAAGAVVQIGIIDD